MQRIRVAVVAVTLLGTACGRALPSPTPSPPPDSVGVADMLLFNCGDDGPPFSTDVFKQPATAELASFGEAAVLRAFLATPDATGFLPQHGWWLAAAGPDTTTFLAPQAGGMGYVMVKFHKGPVGWQLDGYGACRLSVVLAKGLGNASWTFDPTQLPGPRDTEFVALVTETACASGTSAEGRIAAPTILYEPERILVIIGVRPRPGVQTCQSNPSTDYIVRLKEPIGDRKLLDGSFYPPHDPTQLLPLP